jgi:hypothetical protein
LQSRQKHFIVSRYYLDRVVVKEGHFFLIRQKWQIKWKKKKWTASCFMASNMWGIYKHVFSLSALKPTINMYLHLCMILLDLVFRNLFWRKAFLENLEWHQQICWMLPPPLHFSKCTFCFSWSIRFFASVFVFLEFSR